MLMHHPRFRLLADPADHAAPRTPGFRGAVELLAAEARALLAGGPEALQWLRDEEADNPSQLSDLWSLRLSRLDRLLADLQLFARAGQGDDGKAVDLTEVLDEVVGAVEGIKLLAVRRDIQVQFIRFDRIELFVLLYALVGNAVEHHIGPHVEVEITTYQTAQNVFICIADNGPGFGALDKDNVFEPQVRSATSSGSGMGLTIAREIIVQRGGQISIIANNGSNGLCVEVRLPVTYSAQGNTAG